MKYIWAPWRLHYIKHNLEKKCIFCQKAKDNKDKKNYLLYRGKKSFAILNIFPYNNGHFMVAPYKHTGSLDDLSSDEICEMFQIINKYKKILNKKAKPHAYNIGINLGRVAGAGIVDHVHIHVVPRWNGDTNFMPVISDTKVLPQSLEETYKMFSK